MQLNNTIRYVRHKPLEMYCHQQKSKKFGEIVFLPVVTANSLKIVHRIEIIEMILLQLNILCCNFDFSVSHGGRNDVLKHLKTGDHKNIATAR